MKVADKKGVWMTNTSQFRMHDPMTDTYFEAGELTKAADSSWRQLNKAVVKLCDDEGTLIDDPDTIPEVPAEAPAEAAPADKPKAK